MRKGKHKKGEDVTEEEVARYLERANWLASEGKHEGQYATGFVLSLLEEIKRRRELYDSLLTLANAVRKKDEAKIAAMREIVAAMANVSDLGECPFPGCKEHVYVREHAPHCPVTKARALLEGEGRP